ncbi:uncharacterized protein LOC127852530 [Dreissena polymorpha]|uniref:uncharacterized protein LOC127852530 n=1 Tax=Dreissena polymorpha TaxID=45954 RepID=UPI002264E1D8|nr:uncharacterized protein LOC127852530 [Dreissena polymorpha]
MYGSECWRMTKPDTAKLSSFHTTCLRKILRIFWPRKISNNELLQRCNMEDMETLITKRRWRWIGHVLRMNNDSIPKVALRWTPDGTPPGVKGSTDDIVTELNGLVHTPPSSMADIAERLTQSKTPPPQPNRGAKRNILVGRGNAKLTTRPASTPLRIASPVGDVHATRRSVSRASSRIQQGSRMDIVEDDKSKGVLASVTQDEDSVRKVLSISERTRQKVQHDRSQTSNKSLQRQCEVAAAFLKQRKILLITGKVGGGRTRIATELQLALTTVKDDVLPLHFKVPSDLNLLLNNSINAVVVIPDCFGTGKLDTAKVSEFQRLTETS